MKYYLLIVLLVFTGSVSATKIYTINKEEIVAHLTKTSANMEIVCFNAKGEKVVLHYTKNTLLLLETNSGSKHLMLYSAKYVNRAAQGYEFNFMWGASKKLININMNEVVKVWLKTLTNEEWTTNYIDNSGIAEITKAKNDSLQHLHQAKGHSYWINFIPKSTNNRDTIFIIEDACYNLTFKDNEHTTFGVVQKITKDSIFITNTFNQAMASKQGKTFLLLKYAVHDINQINLLKPGGFSYRNVSIDDYNIKIEYEQTSGLMRPYWYAYDPLSGKINFYRSWLRSHSYAGITENNGNAIWYEGEPFK